MARTWAVEALGKLNRGYRAPAISYYDLAPPVVIDAAARRPVFLEHTTKKGNVCLTAYLRYADSHTMTLSSYACLSDSELLESWIYLYTMSTEHGT